MSFERVLGVVDECHVFKIGPRPSAEGYLAAKWYENEIWCGRIRVIEKSNECFIRLENSQTNKLFGKCKYAKDSVEPALDSRRYFVLKIQRGAQFAHIGIGFQERNEAFTFKEAIGRFEKEKEREKRPKKPKTDPKMYRINEGEKIQVNFRLKTKTKTFDRPTLSNFERMHSLLAPKSDRDEIPEKENEESKNEPLISFDFAPPPISGSGRRRRKVKNVRSSVPETEKKKDATGNLIIFD